MNTAGKVVVSVLAGAATGAVLGILFAPDKGTETRKKISNKSKELTEDVKEKIGSFLEKTAEKLESKEGHNHGHKEKAKAEIA